MLTVLLFTQIILTILGAVSLGGKYTGFSMTIYRVFSLLPALVIGMHVSFRLIYKKDDKFWRTFSKVSAIIYAVVFEVLWFLYIYVGLP